MARDHADLAGTEISSTFEGRHITLPNDLLTFVTITGLVRKGQPIVCVDLVGVALNSASGLTDPIAIDTEGIWWLEVLAVNSIAIGQHLFITNGGVITDANLATSRNFGYALGTITVVDGPDTGVIPVKVHWEAPEVPAGQ